MHSIYLCFLADFPFSITSQIYLDHVVYHFLCLASTPASERVQYILGNQGNTDFLDDEEHQSHDIFCEMDELRPVGDDGAMEWKETARYVTGAVELIC